MRRLTLAAVLAAVLGAASVAHAEQPTRCNGTVDADAPHHALLVPAGATCRIAPGTRVKVAHTVDIEPRGTLEIASGQGDHGSLSVGGGMVLGAGASLRSAGPISVTGSVTAVGSAAVHISRNSRIGRNLEIRSYQRSVSLRSIHIGGTLSITRDRQSGHAGREAAVAGEHHPTVDVQGSQMEDLVLKHNHNANAEISGNRIARRLDCAENGFQRLIFSGNVVDGKKVSHEACEPRSSSHVVVRRTARSAVTPDAVIATVAGKVFTALAAGAGKSLAQVIVSKDPALGWLLPAAAQRELLHAQQLAEVKQSLHALSDQVSQLHRQLALDGFTNLVAHINPTLSQISHASNELDALVKLPAGSSTAAVRAKEIREYIRENLLDAPQKLNGVLNPRVPLTTNLIESASRLVHHSRRFFGPSSSKRVAEVYEAFAEYQAELAVLLQNYFHDRPDAYTPKDAVDNLELIRANVKAQEKSLKPAVPDDTVIDTKTGRMWVTDLPSSDVPLSKIAEIKKHQTLDGTRQTYALLRMAGPTGLAGLPFKNWKLPDINTFKPLLEGRGGAGPIEWLHKQGGFNKHFLDVAGTNKWTDETPAVTPLLATFTDVRWFSLREDKLHSTLVTWFGVGDGWKHWFEHYRAGLMYERTIPADERYWW